MNVKTRQANRRGWPISILVLTYLAVSFPVFGQEQKMPAASDLKAHGVTQDQIDSLADIMRQSVEQEEIGTR